MMNDILAHNVRWCFSFEEAHDRFRDSEPELSSREDQCHVCDANASAQRSKGPISGSVTVRPYNQFPRQYHTSLGEDLMRNSTCLLMVDLSRRPVLFKNSDAGFYSFPWARGPWVDVYSMTGFLKCAIMEQLM